MKKAMNLVLKEEESIELIRIMMDDDAVGALDLLSAYSYLG